MSLVLGIVAAEPTGEPSAATSCASTPRCPFAFEYHAITVLPPASEARFGSLP